MKHKFISEDFWLVKMLIGAAFVAVVTFSLVEGSVAENLALVSVEPESQLAQASSFSNYPNLKSVTGADDPVISIGVGGFSDWSTQEAFLNLMKQTRGWTGGGSSFDEHGYPRRLNGAATTLWDLGGSQAVHGRYVVTYVGDGDVSVSGNARVVSRGTNRLVIDINGLFNLRITRTNANNHVRDIAIVREEYMALYEAGAMFNPKYIEKIKDFRQVRFMTWHKTNKNVSVVSWANRPQLDDYRWSAGAGVPIEVMVRLANEAGIDPWFNVSHKATDDYIRNFARYVKDNLDPKLVATVEMSNELWNSGFATARDIKAEKERNWSNESVGYAAYVYMRAAKQMEIWKDVFGSQANSRLIRTFGGQAVNLSWTRTALQEGPGVWRRQEGRSLTPSQAFDSLALTTYFGDAFINNNHNEFSNRARTSKVSAFNYAESVIGGSGNTSWIPGVTNKLKEQKQLADSLGLDLHLYEGGQHVHHTKAGVTDNATQNQLYVDFVRSQQMADLYQQSYNSWKSIGGDGPYMQFTDVQRPASSGSWGLYNNVNDTSPRAQLLERLNRTETPWWENRGGAHFQQGHFVTGSSRNDTLTGSAAEDYILGSTGNDTIYPGPGDDGVNGGSGLDTVLFSGNKNQYSIKNEGEGYRITGPDGSDYVFAVETAQFRNGFTRLNGNVSATAVTSVPQPEPVEVPESETPIDPELEPEITYNYADDPVTAPFRINAAGGAYTDTRGNRWVADTYFYGGKTVNRGSIPIAGTQNDQLYRTERWGDMEYRIPVTDGVYDVTLYFAETWSGVTRSGTRVFTTEVEGTLVGPLDLYADVSRNTATYREVKNVAVDDGELTISFSASANNPVVNAIEIAGVITEVLEETESDLSALDTTDTAAADSATNNATAVTLPYRVNAGGTSFTDNRGQQWLADTQYRGGNTVNRGAIAIAGTQNDQLYRTERWGDMEYRIPVTDGVYDVTLYFAETWSGIDGANERVFSAQAEGVSSGNIDVFAEAGSQRITIRTIKDVLVTDGVLNLTFDASRNNPMINAFEIEQSAAAQVDAIVYELNQRTFDGTANEVLVVPHSSNFELQSAMVELIFTADSVARKMGLISKDANRFGSGGHLSAYIQGGRLYVRFQSNDTSVIESVPVLADTPYTLNIAFTGTKITAQLNSTRFMNRSITTDWSTNTEALRIGAHGMNAKAGSVEFQQPFAGTISNLTITAE